MPAPGDLVHETSSSTGTGNLTLAAVNGKRRFSDVFGTGGSNVFDYFISNRDAAEWERGTGSMSDANTLVRNTVIASSNSNSAVNFSAGVKDIANDVPAADQVYNPNATVTDGHAVLMDGTTGRRIKSAGAAPYVVGGTDVSLADGGTGTSLSSPGADRIPFWDQSAAKIDWLTPGSGLTITGTTMTASSPSEVELGGTTDTTLARASAGEVSVEGTLLKKVGKETIWIPAASMITGASGSPTGPVVEVSAGLNYIFTLDFDGAGTSKEYAYFQLAMPKSWNLGTVTYQVYWTSTATDTDGVVWGLQAVSVADNETLSATFGTAVEITDNAQSNSTELLVSAESSALTVGGTPAAGELVLFRFYRDPANASDGHAEDARLVGIRLFFTTSASTDA